MDLAGPRLRDASRFRNILPKNRPSEDASKIAESHVALTVSAQHRLTDARHSIRQGDAGATFVDDHNEPLQAYTEVDLYVNNFIPNVEQHLASGWAAHLPPGLGTQGEQGDPFQYVHNIGIDRNESSYEGVMQLPLGENSIASSQHAWTRPPFTQNREAFPNGDAYGEFADFISRTMDAPLQSNQHWGNSLALVDNSPEMFRTEMSSFLGQTISCGNTHPLRDVNATDDLLDFSESHAHEYWQSFPSANVEANANTLGGPLENRPAYDDVDDFSMFFDTSTPTKRLNPNLAAVLLGIPEDPGITYRNEELPFSYETRSSPNNGG